MGRTARLSMRWRSTPRPRPPLTRLVPAAVSSRAPTAAATGAPSAPGWTPHCCIALGIDPQTPAILYAGATDAVFKSTDGGGSWHPTGLTKPGVIFISALAIDPQAPATPYAGTDSSGVFKSTHAGGTWGAVTNGLTS